MKCRVKVNYSGVAQLLKSDDVKAACGMLADKALLRLGAGAGYSSDTYNAGTRVVASVSADTHKARVENANNNSIIKAVMGTWSGS